MYIDKLDTLIGNVLDDFYLNVIATDANNNMQTILKEVNFIKHQKKINDIVYSYIITLSTTEIQNVSQHAENENDVKELLTRYILIYLFIFIGINNNSSPEIFINNIIEFSKNQSGFKLKVKNFFNAPNNALIIDHYYIVRNMLFAIENNDYRLNYLKNKPNGQKTFDFIELLTPEFIKGNLLNDDKNIQNHGVIKTTIYVLIYVSDEKNMIVTKIDEANQNNNEYTYIDIVVPTQYNLDFISIESLLSEKDLKKGLADDIWEYMMTSRNNLLTQNIFSDSKIDHLIKSKLLIPIVNDFLMYHKDEESYELIKSKNESALTYIINKMDKIVDMYQNEKTFEEGNKLMYNILANRRATLVNDIENKLIIIKYLQKLNIKGNTEIVEQLNTLYEYSIFPYQNFAQIKQCNFQYISPNTIEVIRDVSFEKENIQDNKLIPIQLRSSGEDMIMNIVGFAIPQTDNPINCAMTNNIHKVSDINKFIDKIKDVIDDKENDNLVYWLFSGNDDCELLKTTIARLYDKVIDIVLQNTIESINDNKLYLQDAYKIVESKKKIIEIENDEDFNTQVEKVIFDNLKNETDIIDYDENKLFGIEGQIHKLAVYSDKDLKKSTLIDINLSTISETGEKIEKEKTIGICQHNITWNDITKNIGVLNSSKFNEAVFEYCKKYIIVNEDKEYLCKSCGHLINIKKYVLGGSYDSLEFNYVPYNLPSTIPLEKLPEYEKYEKVINIIDKLIEKLANMINLPMFIGFSKNTVVNRREIIKSTLDISTYNSGILRFIFSERNEQTFAKYGIQKGLSNIYFFDMDSSIFLTSSTDKDKFKDRKMNNIFSYIVILMMLELSDVQLLSIAEDKKYQCSFINFNKAFQSLFGGLRIKRNNSDDTINVQDYKVMCFYLYMMSCKLSRTKTWKYEYDDKDPRTFIVAQKIIINTTIDILNSILENSYTKPKYIAEIFRTKFFDRMENIYKDDKLFERIEQKYSQIEKTTIINIDLREVMVLATGVWKEQEYQKVSFIAYRPPRLYLQKYDKQWIEFNKPNNFTNCPDGKMHQFDEYDKSLKSLKCSLCNFSLGSNQKVVNISDELIKNEYYKKLQYLYCSPGNKVQWSKQLLDFSNKPNEIVDTKLCVTSLDNNKESCIKCLDISPAKFIDSYVKYKNTEHENDEHERKELLKINNEVNKYHQQINEKIMSKYNKQTDHDEYVDTFISRLEKIFGADKLFDDNIRLRNNVYVIDHDQYGNTLTQPLIITNNAIIMIKYNHVFFKTDVMYYVNYKGVKTEIFYDLHTKMLVGYREENKDYVLSRSSDKMIKIVYSLYNRILLLGYSHKYINLNNEDDDYEYIQDEKIKSEFKNKLINDIEIKRLVKLKKIMYGFQILLENLLNNTVMNNMTIVKPITKQDFANRQIKKQQTQDNEKELAKDKQEFGLRYKLYEESYFSNNFYSLVSSSVGKLKSMNVADNSGNHRVFKHWKAVCDIIYPINDAKKDNYDNVTKYLDVMTIHNVQSNVLLFYILNELSKLIEYNSGSNKFLENNVALFVVGFLNYSYNSLSEEYIESNINILKFKMYIQSDDMEMIVSDEVASEGESDPDAEATEEDIDTAEANDAIDMDIERDPEDIDNTELDQYYDSLHEMND